MLNHIIEILLLVISVLKSTTQDIDYIKTQQTKDLMPLPIFSEIACPFAYKSYSVCILVSYTKEEFRDLMLLKTSNSATTVLKGFLRDEPRVKAVVVLADEDSPNFHTIAFNSKRLSWCSKFSTDIDFGNTKCISSPHPLKNRSGQIVVPSEYPKENRRSFFEQVLKLRKVDKNGYKLSIMVYYDDAFYKKFTIRSLTRIVAIMAVVAEQYSETSFKTRLQITLRGVKYAKGFNWGLQNWNENYPFSRTFNELAHVAVYSETDADLYVFLTVSNLQYLNGLVPKIGSICDYSRHKRVSIIRYQHGDAETAMAVSHEIAHNLGIKHDCINHECRYWESSYVGPRVHEGKDCYGYMDYRDETPGWSECSTNDFADYVNSQAQFCLKSLASDANKSINTGCRNRLPDHYKCTWSCDQWAGLGGSGYNYCNHDWSTKKYCVEKMTGKIKDFCQLSCNNTACRNV